MAAAEEAASQPSTPAAATSRQQPPLARTPWLDSFHDQLANVRCFSSCLRFVDLFGDGENRMVVADMSKKIKVFRGTTLASEHALLDRPVAMCAFVDERSVPPTGVGARSPGLAVAAGPYVFVYRNMRPFSKFTVEDVQLDPVEVDVWRSVQRDDDAYDVASATELLVQARNHGARLSSRSLDLLELEGNPEGQRQFIAAVRGKPLKQQTVITAMETLPVRDGHAPDGGSMLVLGTESRLVLILDSAATGVACRVELGSVPVFMAVTGAFSVDWRLVVACRDGKLYTVTSGDVRGSAVVKKPQIDLEAQPCGGVVQVDKQLFVGTMDGQLHCFSVKGKKLFSQRMPAVVTDLELFAVERQNVVSGVIVALANGEVRVYRGKELVSTIHAGDRVTALRFGRFSREDNSLAIVTCTGAVTVKMLQRSATMEASAASQGPPHEQDIPLPVPKKTQLYIDQTQREREQATEMHRVFQADLCKLRLQTSRAYVKLITEGHMGDSPVSATSLRLNAAVLGLGPFFKIKLDVQNGGARVLTNVPVLVTFNHEVFRMTRSRIVLPVLLPGLLYEETLDVECVSEGAPGVDTIRVLIMNPASAIPFVSAVVNMPQSEELE